MRVLPLPRRLLGFGLKAFVVLVLGSASLTPAFTQEHGAQADEMHHQCRDYDLFLGLLSTEELTRECSEVETFVLSSQNLEPREFLQAYSDAMSPRSVMGTLASALVAEMDGEARDAYMLLDAADRAFYSAMENRGDIARAVAYSVFFSAAKATIVRSFCEIGEDDENCSNIEGFATVEEMLPGYNPLRLDR